MFYANRCCKTGSCSPLYLKPSLHNSSLKSLTNVRPKPDVDTFETAPKTEERFLTYGFKVDKNNQKELQSFDSWKEVQDQVSFNKWQDSGLIEQFYNHNSDYLKEYRAFGEDVSKFAANFQQLGLRDIYDQKGLIGVHELFENREEEYARILDNENHIQEETNHYRKKTSAMFQLMQQTGSDFSAIWDKIKESYVTGGLSIRQPLSFAI